MLGSAVKICVQVDWIASVAGADHTAYKMIELLKSKIGKRKHGRRAMSSRSVASAQVLGRPPDALQMGECPYRPDAHLQL